MNEVQCAFDNCEKHRKRRSRYCSMHITRLQRTGSFEVDTPRLPPLPSAPLVAVVEARGGFLACRGTEAERQAYGRAKKSGHITVWTADHLALGLLGMHPWEVWGDEWFSTALVNGGSSIESQGECVEVSA